MMQTRLESLRKNKAILKITVLAISATGKSQPIVNGILPSMRESLGITQVQSELIATMTSLSMLITLLLGSFLTKYLSIKATVILGLILTGVGGVAPYFLESFPLILIARFILGVGLGLYTPLAIELISLLFSEQERPFLMGYRSSVEQIGRSALTIGVGLLLVLGWQFSFLMYASAFVLAIWFTIFVPEIESKKSEHSDKEKTVKVPKIIYVIAIFTSLIVLNGTAIDVRFPALVAEVKGYEFNANYWIALKPIMGMFAGIIFGNFYNKLGRRLLFISMFGLVTASFITALSSGNFWMLVIGFYLGGIVPAWIFPFVITTVAKVSTPEARKRSMSFVLVAIHGTAFFMPATVAVLQRSLQTDSLTAPYFILGSFTLLLLVLVMVFGNRVIKRLS